MVDDGLGNMSDMQNVAAKDMFPHAEAYFWREKREDRRMKMLLLWGI